MSLGSHFIKVFWEIAMICGAIIIGVTLIFQMSGFGTISVVTLWQIILLVSTIVFRGESFVNFHGLIVRSMSLNYLISSILADISLIILLYYFTPGGKFFEDKAGVILSAYIVIKALYYLIAYFYAFKSSKEINIKLSKMNM